MSPSKYILTPPEDLHPYLPLVVDGKDNFSNDQSHKSNEHAAGDTWNPIYPDFDRWEHRKEEDQIFLNFVSKGYYASSKVNFESISARSSLHKSLPKISDQLASQFSKVLKIREEKINKIPSSVAVPSNSETETVAPNSINSLAGPGFVLPSRVTLTDNRREAWLHDLSLPYVSLHSVSKHIPHGLKRKRVIEQCYTKQIPLKRAMWLIKCCYLIELQQLKAKHANTNNIFKTGTSTTVSSPASIVSPNVGNTNSTTNFESTKNHLIKEWTDNFIHILEKMVFEMNQYYNDLEKLKTWKIEIAYFLKLLGNCYTIELLDNEVVHRWLIEFVSKVDNYEFLPIALHILVVFWDKITKPHERINQLESHDSSNFLLSKITDMLLHKYYVISNSKSMINDEKYIINDIKKNNKIKESILGILTTLIMKLFKEQSLEIFLFPPSSWELYKPCLYEIINKPAFMENSDEVRKILELISYRNETLKNTTLLSDDKKNESSEDGSIDDKSYFQESLINSGIKIIRIAHVDTKFTNLLDDNNTEFDWTQYIEHNPINKTQVIQLILWSIHPSRISHYESNQLVAKLLLLQINSFDGFLEYEIEDTLWTLIFQIAKLDSKNLTSLVYLDALYQLLNILITYGIIKVSTYIRKSISSGIMYLPDSNDKFFHVVLLINLKISPLMKSQYNMVLRNVMEFDPYYFEKYNFDKLLSLVDNIKDIIVTNEENGVQPNSVTDLQLTDIPLAGKMMVAEWYLNYICSNDSLKPVTRGDLLNNFQFFHLNLKVSHHFYKWIEFIVYHQLLNDIETMELLIDILIRYQKLFSQYINDHVLFMKTFLYIYNMVLREKDSTNFQIISFMPFWKFFMKNFSMALVIDNDLRNDLSVVYEEEKTKSQNLEQNKDLVQQLFKDITGVDTASTGLNFVEVFQSNMKILLSCKTSLSSDEFKKSKTLLLLLKASSSRDYNKFMAIFLKRKNYSDNDLICLLASKLLSIEQIKNTLGLNLIINLLAHLDEVFQSVSSSNFYFINTIFCEHYFEEYVKANFQSILSSCNMDDASQYNLFLRILIKYGPCTTFGGISTAVIVKLLKNSKFEVPKVLNDLLHYKKVNVPALSHSGLNPTETEVSMEVDPCSLYAYLDFTNLWVFEAYTLFQIEEIKQVDNYLNELSKFITHVIEITNYDELCSKIFDQVNDIKVIETIIEIFEDYLFKKILQEEKLSKNYLIIVIESIISLSKKVTKVTSTALPISNDCLKMLVNIISYFNQMDESSLVEAESVVDVIMKIFTIHQDYILHYIVNTLQNKSMQNLSMDMLIHDMLSLFDKLSFSLRLKLILYEILSSLKSYSIYIATADDTNDNSPDVAIPGNPVNSLRSSRSNSSYSLSGRNSKFEVPKELLKLPPLQVSSFVKTTPESDNEEHMQLGIYLMSAKRETNEGEIYNDDEKDQWFLYNTKNRTYDCKLKIQAYYNIDNYQTDPNPARSINNACYNLSLFDASLENKNPP